MKTLEKIWVQVAIDVLDINTAEEMARAAAKAGADWIEAGTPLLYYESIRSIRTIVDAAEGRPVVADFKAQDGVYKYFMKAAEYGAQYAVVLGVCNDGSIREAVRAGQDSGIGVIADLFSIPIKQLPARAKELETLGVDAVFVHFGFDEGKYDKVTKPYDGVREVLEVVDIPVGVGSFGLNDALESVKIGASWIVIGGPVFTKPEDLDQLKSYIEAVKSARENNC